MGADRGDTAFLAATDGLQRRLGITLPGPLLRLALTHRSYAYEHGGIDTNERLEFLGDSILGKAVTVMLYQRHPDAPEGELAKRRSALVSTVALAEVARTIDLGPCILLGRGEQLSGGHDKDSILADTMEALFGAAFLALGAEVADALVLRLIQPLAAEPARFGAAGDPKTSLQELLAQLQLPAPKYELSSTGPDHERVFEAVLRVGETVYGTGQGSSKKVAEAAAAYQAWEALSAKAREGGA